MTIRVLHFWQLTYVQFTQINFPISCKAHEVVWQITRNKQNVLKYDYLFLLMLIIHPSWIYLVKWWWVKKNRAYKIDWNGFGIQWPWKFAINLLGHHKTCNYNNVLICKTSKHRLQCCMTKRRWKFFELITSGIFMK